MRLSPRVAAINRLVSSLPQSRHGHLNFPNAKWPLRMTNTCATANRSLTETTSSGIRPAVLTTVIDGNISDDNGNDVNMDVHDNEDSNDSNNVDIIVNGNKNNDNNHDMAVNMMITLKIKTMAITKK